MVERQEIEKRIAAYRFALYDLGLFQDARPTDEQAQQLRRLYQKKLEQLIDRYEQDYGPFILTQSNATESWQEWVEDPWPWDIQKKEAH